MQYQTIYINNARLSLELALESIPEREVHAKASVQSALDALPQVDDQNVSPNGLSQQLVALREVMKRVIQGWEDKATDYQGAPTDANLPRPLTRAHWACLLFESGVMTNISNICSALSIVYQVF